MRINLTVQQAEAVFVSVVLNVFLHGSGMTEFSWLNFISVPAFAIDVRSEDNANIVFWNEAMEELSDVSSEQAVSGRLPSFGRRLTAAVNRGSKSAYLGSLGKFSFKVTPHGQVIATLIEKPNRRAMTSMRCF